jgi:3-(3-hydroxy-phenyl)propionate hydroxylase
MKNIDSLYDVVIVGYGPSGEVLASVLGNAGCKVLVVERWPQPYPLPRLTTLDGEVCRLVQSTSLDIDEAFKTTLVQEACHFVDAEGKPLMSVPYDGIIGGWPSRLNMFQPDFEKAIADKVEQMPNVTVLRGWEAVELWQDASDAHMIVAPLGRSTGTDNTPPQSLKAKYVVGTDGARSFVRQALGVGMTDYDMHQRWLNFDAWHLKPLPERLMSLNIFMDPERPHMYMPIGTRGLRMEFRVMEGETDEEVSKPEIAWEFMERKYGIGREDVKLMRQVVYHYRTRIAEKWRVKRIFLAGDAAHTMPPYMGQGACAAMRDAANLGWKLIEVLKGRSTDQLLDTYQQEREPHVTTLVLASDKLSRIVNITDPIEAEKRNEHMRGNKNAQPPGLPSLETGVLHKVNHELQSNSGKFSPQGKVEKNGVIGRGDDLIGTGFQVLLRKDPAQVFNTDELNYLKSLKASFAVFAQENSAYYVKDIENVYLPYLDSLEADVVILRPDFYSFGAVNEIEANVLVTELSAALCSVNPIHQNVGVAV